MLKTFAFGEMPENEEGGQRIGFFCKACPAPNLPRDAYGESAEN